MNKLNKFPKLEKQPHLALHCESLLIDKEYLEKGIDYAESIKAKAEKVLKAKKEISDKRIVESKAFLERQAKLKAKKGK